MKNKKITSMDSVVTKKVITVPTGTTVSQAEAVMKENRIRHLPVVDENDEIVGVVTARDVANIESSHKYTVELFMIAPVEFINQRESLRTSILRILEKKISCLLVTDDNENVVGIVTTDDILWHLAHLLSEESEDNRHFIGAMGLQIIGDIANKLSIMGI
ncbi:MAG: hypothetical protein A2Z20_01860 [Bdellovibrionales bacterium RBG_16_40_8]|nr:MAG: hypothetical protein A2Z20_01860 [Bdellovibrionales bacterium RBG_16_40_8]